MIPLYDDQPTRSFPGITILLIVINFIVFAFWQLSVGLQQSVELAALVPAAVTTRVPGADVHLLYSMFMHGSWMHLVGNMWFLWIFGNNIEDLTGHFRFVLFYLLCGLAAAGAHILAQPMSAVPLVGASGAVSGILGAYLLKFPHGRVRTLLPFYPFVRVIDVPAFLFLLIWIGIQVLSQMNSRVHEAGSGVAYLAHIGGFIAGMILIPILQSRRRPFESPTTWARYKRDERSW